MRTLAAPPPRENRIDLETQTQSYLQEVLEKAAQIVAETDNFLDRLRTPPKTSVDEERKIEEEYVFDFNFEMQPIVSIIVCKTLEQAFLEVHKEAIEHRRNVELDQGDRRKFDEKQCRIEQRLAYEAAQKELRLKFATDLMGDTISLLERRGYFDDEVEREIKEMVLPWLGRSMEEASETSRLTLAIIERTRKARWSTRHS
jgi:CRISPR/Cas system CSM-associated protein Csm5 (group 7 of RAMP superfamily)